MRKIFKKHRVSIIYTFIILLISFLTLRSSFNLAFDGDSYLTLWRYLNEQKTNPQFNPIAYFFTDYGPQDTFFYILYKFFGLKNPQVFFLTSFIFRLLAAFSFFPLVYLITKNKTASWFSVLFYSINATGIETTNWVFNMPSYLATCIMNLFFFTYMQFRFFNRIKFFLPTLSLFALCVVIQPIRMMFLPVVVFLIEVSLFLKNKSVKNLKYSFFLLSSMTIILIALFTLGNIGDSIGVNRGTEERVSGAWIAQVQIYFSGFNQIITNKQYQQIFNPIAHVGANTIPSNLFKPSFTLPGTTKSFIKWSVFSYAILIFCFLIFAKSLLVKFSKNIVLFALLNFIWTTFCFIIFASNKYPPSLSTFITTIFGGYIIALSLYFYFSTKDTRILFGCLIAIFVLIFSHIIPWVRNPQTLQITTDRYLIISASGFTLLISIFLAAAEQKRYLIYLLLPLTLFHISGTSKYLNNLSNVRNLAFTERVRSSVPHISTFADKNTPTVVYFEKDNQEILYHSLMFGFPVIMYFYQDVENIWNIAYTESWKEVSDAYTTGEGLKRFGTIKISPVPIDHIYAFRLSNDSIIDISGEKRAQLKNETR